MDTGSIKTQKLGIDMGTSKIKIAVCSESGKAQVYEGKHYGRILDTLTGMLRNTGIRKCKLAVTGANGGMLSRLSEKIKYVEEIPAIISGAGHLTKDVGSIIEIGSQGARFITNLSEKVPSFAVNEHCAGGTGSFFEDQTSRLGLKIEDYSDIVSKASSVPRLSGRCAVFAKTDIIHRQQEGVKIEDILMGLCHAMVRNYKAVIVKNLPVNKPVVFCGGVTANIGVIRAIKEIFELEDNELIIPEHAVFTAAYGAAVCAAKEWDLDELIDIITSQNTHMPGETLKKLLNVKEAHCMEPEKTECIGGRQVTLGIDIGSTSTNLVMIGEDGELIDYQYLRTSGDALKTVKNGLSAIREKYGEVKFHAVGVTGSGRVRVGTIIGADSIIDEITAQAKGAVCCSEDVDTVFEIGGQDSKFISIKDKKVVDFQMNKICAAGTGSFIEEQAAKMDIPLQEFGNFALNAASPAALGERCTVFIETAIAAAEADGISKEDIAAGICYAVVRNYLTKVVGNRHTGNHIVLQGGVAYNPGVVAAFQSYFGKRIKISPLFPISGAYGVAVIARNAIGRDRISAFRGYDFDENEKSKRSITGQAKRNMAFYEQAGRLLMDGYDGRIDPKKKTIGVPYVLMMHKFFPMANAFFKELGYNVLLSDATNEETISASQKLAKGETCYPVKLIYGHMQQLIEAGVDYIFMPSIHTMKHKTSRVAHNYGCVYMQTAPRMMAKALEFEKHGIELLNPVFDLDFGKQAMVMAMTGIGRQLNKPGPLCMKALLSGAAAVRKHERNVEEMGKQLMASLEPDDKVLVIITRNYGINDPVLNMGIPRLLLERGHKVISLSHLPAHALDLSGEYDNLYWPFGQHIISGVKMIAHHPNLYAVYLTNHGCGPDSMITHLVKREMGNKPYLQIEVDEHFSNVGVVTRIEAFLNALNGAPAVELKSGFDIRETYKKPVNIRKGMSDQKVMLPDMGNYTEFVAAYFRECGKEAEMLPKFDRRMLSMGRTKTTTKEYLPYTALTGQILSDLEYTKQKRLYLVPQNRGADSDGVYARVIAAELAEAGLERAGIFSPVMEELAGKAGNTDLLLRGLVMGDLKSIADSTEVRMGNKILSWEEIYGIAARINNYRNDKKKITVVGEPYMITTFHEGIFDKLSERGYEIVYMPMSEYMMFLWADQDDSDKKQIEILAGKLARLRRILTDRGFWADSLEELKAAADTELKGFAGANGRYRFAKAHRPVPINTAALIHIFPRYENTAVVLCMLGMTENTPVPVFEMALDGDWDEAAWSGLNSFLHYCS